MFTNSVMRGALVAAAGFLATSFAAAASEPATINDFARVYESPSTSADVVNEFDAGDNVRVTECNRTWCFVIVPGPNGWVRKRYIDFVDTGRPLPPPPIPLTPLPPLPYGADTCVAGYVWRDAIPGDHVCVTGASRALAASENATAGARVDPLGAYGPNTCLAGFVWREAYAGDVVCVTAARRAQVRQENIDGPSHRVLR